MLICPKCGKKYNEKFIRGMSNGKNFCPIISCNSQLIDVPDHLVETVLLLNKKGYITKFCSSSRIDSDPNFEMYIIFDKIDKTDKINNKETFHNVEIPSLFKLSYETMRFSKDKTYDSNFLFPKLTSNNKQTFENMTNEEIIKEKFNLLMKFSKQLYDWAVGLEENKKEKIENNEEDIEGEE